MSVNHILTSSRNPDGNLAQSFRRIESKPGKSGYPEPFDIAFSVVGTEARATVSNLIFQVGLKITETAESAPEAETPNNIFDVTASGYLWAKIDTSAALYQVEELVMSTSVSYFEDQTEEGKYFFKPLYKLTKTGTSLSVALDLRKSMFALWS